MILRANWVVDRELRLHENGSVKRGTQNPPEDGQARPARLWRERGIKNPESEEVVDLGDSILLPGLVNAHCHLDYTEMGGKIPPPQSFTRWIDEINRLKRSWTEVDFSRSIVRGMAQVSDPDARMRCAPRDR